MSSAAAAMAFGIKLLRRMSGEIQMSSFRKVINIAGLNSDSQNTAGFVHGLLSLGDATNSGQDVEANAVREVVRRLTAAGVNAHVIGVVRGYLNSIETKLDS